VKEFGTFPITSSLGKQNGAPFTIAYLQGCCNKGCDICLKLGQRARQESLKSGSPANSKGESTLILTNTWYWFLDLCSFRVENQNTSEILTLDIFCFICVQFFLSDCVFTTWASQVCL
jgi:hypothetical protein